ncbi:MAG: hypothetical protein U1B30_15925 [Pseudomonadota bacterium]|nr:hypothetical protein [Pseudomonadota bacterium]
MAYMAFRLKACGKCQGTLDQDWTGPYWTCLSCSQVYYPAATAAGLALAVGMVTGLLAMQGQMEPV